MIPNKRILITAAFTLFALSLKAQSNTSSLYSRFGVGEIQRRNSIPSLGMGGISNGLRATNSYNFINPASYSELKLSTFEVTGFSRTTTLKTSNSNQTNYDAGLNSLSLGFPLSSKWGASFGLKPFSSMGYKVTVPTTQAGVPGTVNQIYEGDGGINQFYIGTGYEVYKGLSIGANASFLFGKLSASKSNEFNDTLGYYNVKRTNATSVGDFYFNYGIQYVRDIQTDLRLIVGYNGSLSTNVRATRNLTAITYRGSGANTISEDTSAYPVDEKGSIVIPASHSLGFAFERKNKWILGADVSMAQWSKYEDFDVNPGLKNTLDISAGGQYTPKYNAVGSYFKTVDYRLGMNYGQSYVDIRGENISQYGVTAGLGLPLARAGAKINLACELGQRGTTNNNLIKEEYVNVYFGITFSDKWFTKRKYE